jgi:hypothetical protein
MHSRERREMRIYQRVGSLAVICSALIALPDACSGQVDESTPLSRTAKLIEARKLSFGLAYQDEVAKNSQSNTPPAQPLEANVDQEVPVNPNNGSVNDVSGSTLTEVAGESSINQQGSFTPVLSRSLSVRVQAVSTSGNNLGSGLIPLPSASRELGVQPLPIGVTRGMSYTHVCWKASLIQHYPLYFEDAMLERHGHSRCWHGCALPQSVVSGVKFFATIPLLPYHETLRPKHKCVYALGHYRPGTPAPCATTFPMTAELW